MADRPNIKLLVVVEIFTTFVLLAGIIWWLKQPAEPSEYAKTISEQQSFGVEQSASESLEATRLDASIDAALEYMLKSIDEDGRFVYRINLDGYKQQKKYNVLRHGGAIYSLLQALEMHSSADAVTQERVRDAIVRGAKYLRKRYVQPVSEQPNMLAVYSRPDEESLGGFPQAKLGGTGLGLIALVGARTLDPSVISLRDLRKLGAFVEFMQREDGNFHSKYQDEKGYVKGFVSLYYPGETVLGLLRLYQVDPNPRWIRIAIRAVNYLIESRKGVKKLPADHWLMIAIGELSQTSVPSKHAEFSSITMLNHSKELAVSMLYGQARVAKANPFVQGSFASDGRCTPSATRLEGLIATLDALEAHKDPDLNEQLTQSIVKGIHFLLRCQTDHKKAPGGFLRAVEKRQDRGVAFNKRQSEIRIDYVQHALSAILGMRYSICEKEGVCK